MQETAATILNQSIEQLDLSQEFKGVAEILGLYTLNDVLNYHTRDIIKLPGFTIGLVHEYIRFLEEGNLGHLVDPIQKRQ